MRRRRRAATDHNDGHEIIEMMISMAFIYVSSFGADIWAGIYASGFWFSSSFDLMRSNLVYIFVYMRTK